MVKYFGTDGIRGKAYDFLNFDLAFLIGKSLKVLNNELLIIGKDTRESGDMLLDAITQGAKISGIDVLDLGVVSTPLLAYISQKNMALGVMITASHNPYQDNGIKVFIKGKKLFQEEEDLIEDILSSKMEIPKANRIGINLPKISPLEIYQELFDKVLVKTSFSIGIDLANGATFETGKYIFQQITDKLTIIGDQPDGRNINLNVGSTHLEKIVSTVLNNKLDFGFAFDGDGDRLMAIDYLGTTYDGDLLIYITALYLNQLNLLKDKTVVLTKMSNLGIIKALSQEGIKVIQTDVGDKYVLESLETNNYTIGGENSGHIINRYLLNTGDGVLNAAFLVKILFETKKTLAELTSNITMYPDKLVNLRQIDRQLAKHEEVQSLVKEIENQFGEFGKVLVRASGTEPLIRISASAPTEKEVDEAIDKIVKLIEKLNNHTSI